MEHPDKDQRDVRYAPGAEYSSWWQALGIFLTAVSLFGLAQKLFVVGLSPLFGGVLVYYRKIFHYPFELIGSVLSFSPPEWYRDAFIVSFFVLAAHVRSDAVLGKLELNDRFVRTATFILYPSFLSVPLLGIVLLLNLVVIFTKRPGFIARPQDTAYVARGLREARHHTLSLLCAIATAIAFLILNSQM